MGLELVANCSPSTNRVALVEDGKLTEVHIEHASDRTLVGNIMKARVTNIVPGMQCAFVDIGIERDLFLPLSDINLGDPWKGGEDGAEESEEEAQEISIRDVLKVGQEILVQVIKEPIGTKGARGTTYLTLPGRYLVLMPTSDHIGISRRIDDPVEIARLHEIGLGIKPEGVGFIIRTVAAGRSRDELREDLEFLLNLWESIQKQEMQSATPSLIHEESSLLLKVVRDLFSSKIEAFHIDDRDEYNKVMNYCKFFPKILRDRIQYSEEDVFSKYGIEEEIHRAIHSRVSLPSGGYVIIQETEALISIDVNTGSYIGTNNLEETVYNTNLEAAVEIARQLRLRNLGGIIVIDFIDMGIPENRETVYDTLHNACKNEKTRYNIKPITELGILEMTRQRVGKTLSSKLLENCPYCKGRGRIHSREYMCNKIFRELKKFCSSRHHAEVVLANCHPEVAAILLERDEYNFKQLEKDTGVKIFVRGDSTLHFESFKFS